MIIVFIFICHFSFSQNIIVGIDDGGDPQVPTCYYSPVPITATITIIPNPDCGYSVGGATFSLSSNGIPPMQLAVWRGISFLNKDLLASTPVPDIFTLVPFSNTEYEVRVTVYIDLVESELCSEILPYPGEDEVGGIQNINIGIAKEDLSSGCYLFNPCLYPSNETGENCIYVNRNFVYCCHQAPPGEPEVPDLWVNSNSKVDIEAFKKMELIDMKKENEGGVFYPNPFTSNLNLIYSNSPLLIEIRNTEGELVYNKLIEQLEGNKNEISIKNFNFLPTGVYFAKILYLKTGELETSKLIKL